MNMKSPKKPLGNQIRVWADFETWLEPNGEYVNYRTTYGYE